MWNTRFSYHELNHVIYFLPTQAGLYLPWVSATYESSLIHSVVQVRSRKSHSSSRVFSFHIELTTEFFQLYFFSLSSVPIAWCGVCSPATCDVDTGSSLLRCGASVSPLNRHFSWHITARYC